MEEFENIMPGDGDGVGDGDALFLCVSSNYSIRYLFMQFMVCRGES